MLAQCSDPLTRRWTTVPDPYERRHARDFIASRRQEWERARWAGFAVEVDGGFAGTVDLRLDSAPGPYGRAACGALGFALGPWARGRGTTTLALRLLLPWAFDALGLDVVHWHAEVGNWASRRVAWSVGFRVEGTVRGALPARGRRVDGWVGSLRRGDDLRPAHDWFDPPTLATGQAVLRAHQDEDDLAMVAACSDPLTQYWLPHLPTPYTARDARAHLEQIREEHATGNGLYWAVTTTPTGPLLGEIGLFGLARGVSRSGELGYWAHPDGRGTGMTTQAVRLAARHALLPRDVGGLGLSRVLIRAADGNVASQRVAVAAGFVPTGRDRGAELLRDRTTADLLRFDLLSEEYGL
jgi:RimJ/RimL family protein N-acetyltransferase